MSAARTPLEAARLYARCYGWPVFPCHSTGPARKRPLTTRGFHAATTDPARIAAWWRKWPTALIGVPTGPATAVVLDVDSKDPLADGRDSLEDLGLVIPDTPIAHSGSGGYHAYFACPDRELRCSAGLIGPGLDVRASGGYCIVASPNSGYAWDPLLNFSTVSLAPAPDWLWPPRPSRARPQRGLRLWPTGGFSSYAEASINSACNAIAGAPNGQQEKTLNSEAFSIGTLAGAGGIPADLALGALLRAGHAMPDYDPSRPWRPEEIDLKVRRAFRAGEQKPREVRHATAVV